ncbi:hypothetical protein [uncultured Pseudokineococcus sp.]|uniref:hypothetical protein n=1 Tax=uncultured Pseudokineococcus sp. TaxID=1642928 RepID=UPI0026270B32|nr:hypothetical protein [uncultured Pseudokineococcus sp.]
MDVLEMDDELPLGRFLPCDLLTDPQQELAATGVHAEYRVEVDDEDGIVVTGAFAPPAELTTDLLDFLDSAPRACETSDREVLLDTDAASAAAAEAGLAADDVRLLRKGPEETPGWRAYAVVGREVVVVGASGTAVVGALDTATTVADAVQRLQDDDGSSPPA